MRKIFSFFFCLWGFSAIGQIVVSGEYFFNTDPGFGNGNSFNLSPSGTDITQNFTIATLALQPGFHKLYIRTKDSDGKWSHTARLSIEVMQPSNNIIAAEYFFNTDPGIGNAYSVSFSDPLPDGTFSFSIPLDNIPDSVRSFYLRVKDDQNKWSLTQWQRDSVATAVTGSNLWSNPTTWSTGKIPDANTVIILRRNVIVDINGFAKSLTTIGVGVTVTVSPGRVLTITGE